MTRTKKETNRERFIRLAEKRTTKVIKTIQLIGNLSNRNNYMYEDEDVSKIFAALEEALKSARAEFETKAPVDEPVFKL